MVAAALEMQLHGPTSRLPVADLIARCVRRPVDEKAWEEFVRRFHGIICKSVKLVFDLQAANPGASSAAHDALLGELVDLVYQRLVKNRCEALRLFACSKANSLGDYILLISTRVVRDHFRRLC